MGLNMARLPKARLALLLIGATALAACQPGSNPFARKSAGDGEAAPATPAATSVTLVDRDVEAPEVYQVTDQALWDGRPSLGGVWVASPDATDPERVILRNPGNGKFVIGALFKREIFNPGPKLQISSDAAEALGMLAGQPAQISVTALRREEVPAETDAAKPLLDANVAVTTTNIDAVASAAIDEAEGKPAPSGISATAPAAAPAPAADLAPTTTAAVEQAATPPAPAGNVRIQIGIFSVEGNADRAVAALKKAGVAATVRKETTQGKTWWSVVANGSGDRAALLEKVKGLGFQDAYLLRG